jgi:hypothetical protein
MSEKQEDIQLSRKTIDSVKIAMQEAGSYPAPRKIKDWTLWRD